MGVLNQPNSYLQGHLEHFEVLSELIHRTAGSYCVTEKSHLSV